MSPVLPDSGRRGSGRAAQLLSGLSLRMLKLMNRLLKTISMLEYFINNSWEWSTNNTEMLLSELSPEDQRVRTA